MKFCGIVGYCETVERTGEHEGAWIPDVVEERDSKYPEMGRKQ